MNNTDAVIQAVGEQISVAAQLSPDQIKQLSDKGFQAVVNLRAYQEEGATDEDHRRVEAVGLPYVNMPVKPSELNEAFIDQIVQQIHELPRPLLVYCGSSLRATFISLLYIATHHDLTLEAAKAKGKELGFDFDSKPPFRRWLEHYIQTKSTK